jgi:DNA-binding transcriptional LysR family regulator
LDVIYLNVKQLQTFIVVARLLNFRAAAEELSYPQSTVSDHIRNLEQELGVKLFERLGRKVFLNEQGKKLTLHLAFMMNLRNHIFFKLTFLMILLFLLQHRIIH